jgi:hypothetical protein
MQRTEIAFEKREGGTEEGKTGDDWESCGGAVVGGAT